MARTPDADRQARAYIDQVLETQRRSGHGVRLSKKRYEAAVARVADTFREFLASKDRVG